MSAAATETKRPNSPAEARVAEREWIPCSERMPAQGHYALVSYDDEQLAVAWHSGGVWYETRVDSTDGDAEFADEVTHWMHLPIAPKADP